jgi:hypothetical protein
MNDKKDPYSSRRLHFNIIQRPDYDESLSENPSKDGMEWHLEFGDFKEMKRRTGPCATKPRLIAVDLPAG